MHICCQKEEFQGMEMITKNMHFSLKKVILSCVLLNCGVSGLSSVFIIILSHTYFNNSGVMGFFELGTIGVLLPIAGIIAGFKIGDFYIFIYNTFAGLLNIDKIELNTKL
jgi:hypothetical protein